MISSLKKTIAALWSDFSSVLQPSNTHTRHIKASLLEDRQKGRFQNRPCRYSEWSRERRDEDRKGREKGLCVWAALRGRRGKNLRGWRVREGMGRDGKGWEGVGREENLKKRDRKEKAKEVM